MKYHIEKNTVQETLILPHKLMIRLCDSLVRMKIVRIAFQ